MNIGTIVLAAGASSRMGRSKQLLEIEGEPLLCRCIKVALAVNAENVIVILGANEKPHREIIRKFPVHVINNFYWKTGLGSSIKTGMNYLIQNVVELDAVIILVCDQPALTAEHIKEMIEKFMEKKKAIVASRYANSNGVPVLFGRSFFSNLLLLSDDQGAKKLSSSFPIRLQQLIFQKAHSIWIRKKIIKTI